MLIPEMLGEKSDGLRSSNCNKWYKQMHIEENQYTLSTPSEHGYNMIRFKLFLKLTAFAYITYCNWRISEHILRK
jgi:hypothetical protein